MSFLGIVRTLVLLYADAPLYLRLTEGAAVSESRSNALRASSTASPSFLVSQVMFPNTNHWLLLTWFFVANLIQLNDQVSSESLLLVSVEVSLQ